MSSRQEIWYDAIGRVSDAAAAKQTVAANPRIAGAAFRARARSELLPFARDIGQTVAWATHEKSRSRSGCRARGGRGLDRGASRSRAAGGDPPARAALLRRGPSRADRRRVRPADVGARGARESTPRA